MISFPHGERLSPAAQSRLEDYVSEFVDEIVSEAVHLNPDDVVTSRDIGDAYDQLRSKARGYGGSTSPLEATRIALQPRSVIFPLMSALASAATAALLFSVTFRGSGNTPISDNGLILVAAFIAYIAALASASAVLLTWMRARRERARAVRYAELGGRDDDKVAYYLAEALSSRSTKSDDSAYLTARFIPKWARLEDRLRRLAIESLGMPEEMAEDYPIGPLLSDLTEVGILDSKRGDEFAQILDVRNRLAHGGRAPIAETQVSLDYMDVLEDYLDHHIRSHASRENWNARGE